MERKKISGHIFSRKWSMLFSKVFWWFSISVFIFVHGAVALRIPLPTRLLRRGAPNKQQPRSQCCLQFFHAVHRPRKISWQPNLHACLVMKQFTFRLVQSSLLQAKECYWDFFLYLSEHGLLLCARTGLSLLGRRRVGYIARNKVQIELMHLLPFTVRPFRVK